jgi:hypothetical protein
MSRASRIAILFPVVLVVLWCVGPGLSRDAGEEARPVSDGESTLAVHVIDAGGTSLAGRVVIAGEQSALTDEHGIARFEHVSAGRLRLVVAGSNTKLEIEVAPSLARDVELRVE